MQKLTTTDPIKIDAFLKKWEYTPGNRQANELGLGILGLRAAIGMAGDISFETRMPVNGERRSKKVGRFRLDGNGTVIYGMRKAMADAQTIRECWHDEMDGKITVPEKDIPIFSKMLELYEDALTNHTCPLLTGRTLPQSWEKQLPDVKAVYAPFIKDDKGNRDVKLNHMTREAVQQAHTTYLTKRFEETGKRPYQTIRLIFNAVRPVLKWANEKHWLPDHVLKGLRANVPDGEDRARILLPGEWQKTAPAIDKCHEDREVGMCMRWMLYTACRKSMATMMKWDQIETVDASEHGGPEELTLWCVPKENMKMKFAAIFPIVGAAKRMLDELRNRPGEKCRDWDYVFNETARHAWGDKEDRGNANYWQERIHELSGTDNWHRHDLRRTTASYLDTFGADMPTVKKLLAHRGRTDKSATQGYLTIGKSLSALVILAKQMERVHAMYDAIEAGKVTKDLKKVYSELKSAEEVRAFMKEFDIDKSLIEITENEQHRAPVVPIRKTS